MRAGAPTVGRPRPAVDAVDTTTRGEPVTRTTAPPSTLAARIADATPDSTAAVAALAAVETALRAALRPTAAQTSAEVSAEAAGRVLAGDPVPDDLAERVAATAAGDSQGGRTAVDQGSQVRSPVRDLSWNPRGDTVSFQAAPTGVLSFAISPTKACLRPEIAFDADAVRPDVALAR